MKKFGDYPVGTWFIDGMGGVIYLGSIGYQFTNTDYVSLEDISDTDVSFPPYVYPTRVFIPVELS